MRFREYSIRSEKQECEEGTLLKLIMRSPVRGELVLRERGSDINTFTEIVEQEIYKDVVVTLRDCRTIIDLGANIGLASRYFADCFQNCKILAVEPNQSTYELLISNVQDLVTRGRCQTLRAAVWNSEATLAGGAPDDPDHYSAFAVHETAPGLADNAIVGWPMSKIITHSGFEKIDLLKVDIEGAEVELFKGNSEWLQRVNAIAIEFHENSRKDCGFDGLMKQYGFRVIDSDSHTVLAIKRSSLHKE